MIEELACTWALIALCLGVMIGATVSAVMLLCFGRVKDKQGGGKE